jgi:hypothetical protein
MNRATNAAVRLGVVLLMSATSSLLPAAVYGQAQTADDAFKLGMQAREQSLRQRNAPKWSDVATQMRRAIEMDGTDSSRKVRLSGGVLGFNRSEMEYLPHFFLGEAFFNAGECVGAMDQWTISQQQKAVEARREFVTIIENGYRQCEAKGYLPPAELNAARESARQAIDQAEGMLKTIAALAQANPGLVSTESLDGARKEIGGMRGRLTNAERSRLKTELADVRSGADRAIGTLRNIENTINIGVKNRSLVTTQIADVDKIIAGAHETDRQIDLTNFVLTPELRSSRQSALGQLENASGRLNDGKRTQNQPTVAEARSLATEAASSLTKVLEGVRQLQKELADKAADEVFQRALGAAFAAAGQVFSFADASLARLAERLLKLPERATPDLTTQRDGLQKQLDSLRKRLDMAHQSRNIGDVQSVRRAADRVRARLDELNESFGPVTIEERVGTALYAAARSFLDGEYAKTIATLDSSNAPPDGPLQAHVHLFRAASLFALYVRSGETDQAMLTRANEEIGRSRGLDPGLDPDKRVFSPRFVGAYRSGGIQRGGAAPDTAPAR